MADKTIWGCAETGTYSTGSPNPHVSLSGTASTAFAVAQVFSGAMSNAETATVNVFKDATNWAIYSGATFTTGTPNLIDLSAATLQESAGTLANSDAVTVIGLSPQDTKPQREVLAAARTYYVATTGNDSNTGLSAGSPFLTIQKAVDVVCSLDMSIYQVTIQVADGTYTGLVTLKRYVGSLAPIIQGNTSDHSSVLISTTSQNCVTIMDGSWVLKWCELRTTTSGNCIQSAQGAASYLALYGVNFGACAGRHTYIISGYLVMLENYTISGGATMHLFASRGGVIQVAVTTVTLTGAPNFSTHYAEAQMFGGLQLTGCSYSGSATGKRYDASLNGVISSGTTLPGDVAGTTATGGQYV